MKKTKLILPIVASTAVVATLPIALTSCGDNISVTLNKDSGSNTWSSFETYTIKKRNTYTFTLKDSKGLTGKLVVMSACESSTQQAEIVTNMNLEAKINGNDVKFGGYGQLGYFTVDIPTVIPATSNFVVELTFGQDYKNAVTKFIIQ